ncbi:MAG: acyltransferase [Nitrosomonadales bacterium]|nr:acyltransferase [Nitrosomonadales bacterium]
MAKIFQLLRWLRQYRSRRNVLGSPKVKISERAKIDSYRKIALFPSSKLTIGSETGIYATLVTEHADAEIAIGERTFIGDSQVIAANQITIGDDVLISWGCTVVDHDSHSIFWSKRSCDVHDWLNGKKNWQHVLRGEIKIQNKVWIGANVTILKNVTIGEGAVIGTGSVVTKDVPSWTIVAGNPAKVIRMIPENER